MSPPAVPRISRATGVPKISVPRRSSALGPVGVREHGGEQAGTPATPISRRPKGQPSPRSGSSVWTERTSIDAATKTAAGALKIRSRGGGAISGRGLGLNAEPIGCQSQALLNNHDPVWHAGWPSRLVNLYRAEVAAMPASQTDAIGAGPSDRLAVPARCPGPDRPARRARRTFQSGYGGARYATAPAQTGSTRDANGNRLIVNGIIQAGASCLFQRQSGGVSSSLFRRRRVRQRRHDHRRLHRHRQQPERRGSGQPQHRHRQLHARPTPATSTPARP